MKNKNITNHALMRYASRVFRGHIINERTWEQWKKNHRDELPEVERKLKEDMQKAEYIATGAYEGNRKADFYINEEAMMTFIVNEDNLVTCYHIDFGLDEVGNKEMLQVLLDNIERSELAEANFEENTREKKEKIIVRLNIATAEIKELNAKLERAREEKNIADQELKKLDLQHKELLATIETAKEKIVRSKMAI